MRCCQNTASCMNTQLFAAWICRVCLHKLNLNFFLIVFDCRTVVRCLNMILVDLPMIDCKTFSSVAAEITLGTATTSCTQSFSDAVQ